MKLRAGGRVLELDDPSSSSMAPIFSDTWLGTELWPAARALVAFLEERRPTLACVAQELELGANPNPNPKPHPHPHPHPNPHPNPNPNPNPKQVLELGAGTGACGLAAAALGARRVLLTDKPVLLPLLRANVAANCFDRSDCVVECAELTWRSRGDERRSGGDEREEHACEGAELPALLPAGADLVLASLP